MSRTCREIYRSVPIRTMGDCRWLGPRDSKRILMTLHPWRNIIRKSRAAGAVRNMPEVPE